MCSWLVVYSWLAGIIQWKGCWVEVWLLRSRSPGYVSYCSVSPIRGYICFIFASGIAYLFYRCGLSFVRRIILKAGCFHFPSWRMWAINKDSGKHITSITSHTYWHSLPETSTKFLLHDPILDRCIWSKIVRLQKLQEAIDSWHGIPDIDAETWHLISTWHKLSTISYRARQSIIDKRSKKGVEGVYPARPIGRGYEPARPKVGGRGHVQ